MNPAISDKVVAWFDKHGRKNLPWQQNKTPYRVWISEIMLQQTQVTTVIPYYEKFMHRFPTVTSIAKAKIDDVMYLWAGLGYYSRARNIFNAAKMIENEFKGVFPDTLENLLMLPGIGKSTAGAILAIAFKKRAAILDGNVKRVLSRYTAFTDPVNAAGEKKLWALAESLLPNKHIDAYTQAMMDLGATLCIRGEPLCLQCPLQKNCKARQLGIQKDLPVKKIKITIPTRNAILLILKFEDTILLEKRQMNGIWGGLWSLPQIDYQNEFPDINELTHRYKLKIRPPSLLKQFRHTFSHYHLNIQPVLLEVVKKPTKVMEGDQQIWYNLKQPETVGLPKPVKKILEVFS